jgi:hypothetical protein
VYGYHLLALEGICIQPVCIIWIDAAIFNFCTWWVVIAQRWILACESERGMHIYFVQGSMSVGVPSGVVVPVPAGRL